MPDAITLAPRSAFDGLLKSVGDAEGAGVTVRERVDLQIATVIARNSSEALAARVRSAYGIDLPSGPHRAASQELAFVGTGPRTWLAVREDGGGDLIDDLRRGLSDAAAVSDQSDGYAVLRLWGERVRATFEKGLGVDLHPRAFRPGDAAVTTCGILASSCGRSTMCRPTRSLSSAACPPPSGIGSRRAPPSSG